MKNFDLKKILTAVIPVVIGLVVYNVGKTQLDRIKTTPPAVTSGS